MRHGHDGLHGHRGLDAAPAGARCRAVRAGAEDHRRLLRRHFDAAAASRWRCRATRSTSPSRCARGGARPRPAQRALAEHDWESEPIRVRIGIHSGEPVVSGELYAGLDVHRAARVMSAGHGGQVLVSEATCALVRRAPDELALHDLGEHRLKDLLGAAAALPARREGVPAARGRCYRRTCPCLRRRSSGAGANSRRWAPCSPMDVRLLTLTGAGRHRQDPARRSRRRPRPPSSTRRRLLGRARGAPRPDARHADDRAGAGREAATWPSTSAATAAARARQLRTTRWRRRPSWPNCFPPARSSTCWPRAASRSTSPASASTPSRRSGKPTPSRSSTSAPARPAPGRRERRDRRDLPPARSPAARDRARRRPRQGARAAGVARAARTAAAAPDRRPARPARTPTNPPRDDRLVVRPARHRRSSSCSPASPSSRAAAPSRRPSRFATPTSTRSSRSSTRAFSAGRTSASGCSRRSGSTQARGSRSGTSCGSVTDASSSSWRSASIRTAAGRIRRRGSSASTPTGTTTARCSAGRSIRAGRSWPCSSPGTSGVTGSCSAGSGKAGTGSKPPCGRRTPHRGHDHGRSAGVANLAVEQGDLDRAAEAAEEALALDRALGDEDGAASSRGVLADVVLYRGDLAAAAALYEEAAVVARQRGDEIELAVTLGNLGSIATLQGDLDRAEHRLLESLAIFREQADTSRRGDLSRGSRQGRHRSATITFMRSPSSTTRRTCSPPSDTSTGFSASSNRSGRCSRAWQRRGGRTRVGLPIRR